MERTEFSSPLPPARRLPPSLTPGVECSKSAPLVTRCTRHNPVEVVGWQNTFNLLACFLADLRSTHQSSSVALADYQRTLLTKITKISPHHCSPLGPPLTTPLGEGQVLLQRSHDQRPRYAQQEPKYHRWTNRQSICNKDYNEGRGQRKKNRNKNKNSITVLHGLPQCVLEISQCIEDIYTTP